MNRYEAGKLVSKCTYLSAAEKSVFRTLLERSNNYTCGLDAKFTPTVPELVLATSLHRATVLRSIGHLETHRWMERTAGKGRGHKSRYQLVPGIPDPSCDCKRSHQATVSSSNSRTRRPEKVALPPESAQVKSPFRTRTAEEEKEEHGCKVNPDDQCRGAGALLSCQLCPQSPTYWRRSA